MKKFLMILTFALVIVSCKESRCSNGEQNKKEEGIDCGGPCEPCVTCNDGIKNQDEVNTDCGGICGACDIEYPSTGMYGTNILTLDDTLYLSATEYSMRAIIPAGSSLKLKLNSISGGTWGWQPSTIVGWSKGDLIAGQQDYEALNETCEMKILLTNVSPGLFEVWYYENSESVTRVSYVSVN